MTVYNSSFQDADYGCGEASTISGEFTVNIKNFRHSDLDPSVALVDLSYTNMLTLQNIKYSTTDTQDISAWLVYTSSQESLGSTVKVFVQRQDCTATMNFISGSLPIPIKADTSIRLGARWSGFEINPDGLPMQGLEWFDYPLTSDLTITPPQNLQVTFPTSLNGTINASIDSWSANPNIGGTVQSNGNQWNWKVELITSNGDILSTKTFINNNLTASLTADTSRVSPNQEYTLRVTACNEYQTTTSVTSPVIASPPLPPVIRRITYSPIVDDKVNMTIDWAKPRSSGRFDERVQLTIPGYVDNRELSNTSGGGSVTGSTVAEDLPVATKLQVILTNTSSAGQGEVAQTEYTPSNVPKITATWNDLHNCVTFRAEATNVSRFYLSAGYSRGGGNWGVTGTELQVCNPEYYNPAVLYVQATPIVSGRWYNEAMGTATFPVLHPILGLTKTCDKTLNLVDIVECKNGAVTPRWQVGERVRINPKCPPPPPPSTKEEIIYPSSFVSNVTVRYSGPEDAEKNCRTDTSYQYFPAGTYNVNLRFNLPESFGTGSYYVGKQQSSGRSIRREQSNSSKGFINITFSLTSEGCDAGSGIYYIERYANGVYENVAYIAIGFGIDTDLRTAPGDKFDMTIAPSIGVTIGDVNDQRNRTMKPLYFKRF